MNLAEIKVLNFICALAVGGTERQFVYATRALQDAGLKMHAGFIRKQGAFLKEFQTLQIPCDEYMTSSMYSYRTARQQWRLSRDMRRQGIQVLHAYGVYANVFAVPAAKLARCPVTIASVRDTGVYLTPMMRLSQKMVCRLADCILANSNAVRDWLISDGVNPRRIHVIRNGIVIPPAKVPVAGLRQELGIPVDAPLVATVCRVARSKGLEYLLQAAASIAASLPDVRFVIAGKDLNEPGYKAELESYAEQLKLNQRVYFLGERQDVSSILREADLFVLPTLSEGLSNVLLEAMTASLPVIATNVGGNPEVVQDGKTGLLVPPKNVAELARVMSAILKSPEMGRRFGEAGRQRVVTEFSVQNMIRQTQELYASLLERQGLPHVRLPEFQGHGTE